MQRSLWPITLLALSFAACDPNNDSDVDLIFGPLPTDKLFGTAPDNPTGTVLPDEADFDYSTGAQFTFEGILGDADGVMSAEDPSIIDTSGCDDTLQMDRITACSRPRSHRTAYPGWRRVFSVARRRPRHKSSPTQQRPSPATTARYFRQPITTPGDWQRSVPWQIPYLPTVRLF
ncbi:MAG: hypothetical protein ACJATT_005052 [Myxococcota bacterium]|jgi:hypothetical protein